MNKIMLLMYLMFTLNNGVDISDSIKLSPELIISHQIVNVTTNEYDAENIKKEFSKDQMIELIPAVNVLLNELEKGPKVQEEEKQEELKDLIVEPVPEVINNQILEPTAQPKQITDSNNALIEVSNGRYIDINKPMCALTFDDGPNVRSTNKILDILEKYNVVGTFFDLGYLVEMNPDVVKRGDSMGCEIGNHSYAHKDLNKLTIAQIKEDMRKSEQVFEKVIGHKTKLFRPPYGNANQNVRSTVNYPLINWNVDTLDWKTRNSASIIAEIRKISNYDGKIILMHSIYDSTAKALETIVPELINKGYQLVTVSELAYYKGYTNLQNGKIYYNFSN